MVTVIFVEMEISPNICLLSLNVLCNFVKIGIDKPIGLD